MADLEDFKLGHRFNPGTPVGERVICKVDVPADVEAMCKHLESIEHAWCDEAAAMLRQQAADNAQINELLGDLIDALGFSDYPYGQHELCDRLEQWEQQYRPVAEDQEQA